MKLSLLCGLLLGMVGSMPASELLAVLVKAPWPQTGCSLFLVNTGVEEIPFSAVSIEGMPKDSSDTHLSGPTFLEHIEFGPGKKIHPSAVSAALSPQRLTPANWEMRLVVILQSGDKRLKVDRVIIQKED